MHKADAIEILARGVLVKAGRLLVCHTKGAANVYLPGGHVEFGERAEDSLRREIAEELGVPAKVGRFLGAMEHTFTQKKRRVCEINLVFAVTAAALNPARAPRSREDYIEFRWVPLSRLADSALEPAPLRDLLPAWLAAGSRAARWASTY